MLNASEARLVAGPELVEHGLDGRAVLLEVAVGRVDDLDQHVGPVDLLERRPERVDQLVRQLVDEAHGVGHDRRLAVAELDLAAGRIERREQLVLGPRDLGADEAVEQRRLAGVRVADDADRRPQPAIAAAGGRLALLADLLDPLLHLRDPGPDDPPVRLELALAGAARADAALGAREVGPQPGQPRQLVLELGQLDLEPALVGLGVEREDVEDQPAAVDDLDVEQLLERPLLGGRQLVVGDEQVEAGLALGRDELLRLALADVPVGVDVAAVLPLGADHLRPGRGGQVGELGERILGAPAVVAAGVDGDEERLLDGRGEVDEVGGHGLRRIALVPPRPAPGRDSPIFDAPHAVSCAPSRPSDQKARHVRRVSNDESTHRGHTACHRGRPRRAVRDLAHPGLPGHRQVDVRRQGSHVHRPAVGPGVLRDRPGC